MPDSCSVSSLRSTGTFTHSLTGEPEEKTGNARRGSCETRKRAQLFSAAGLRDRQGRSHWRCQGCPGQWTWAVGRAWPCQGSWARSTLWVPPSRAEQGQQRLELDLGLEGKEAWTVGRRGQGLLPYCVLSGSAAPHNLALRVGVQGYPLESQGGGSPEDGASL